ncbi:hypothetical protein B0H11DRAFT_1995587 [Mycena galericulata]|nr:hypothetical protein B0H11DRAFT_1995587 [Mycena galericulata]
MSTRDKYEERMDITRWFPNEVITDIVESAARNDQATLCRVSKLFHNLSLPVLTRAVVVRRDSLDSLSAFCSALIANPSRADAVRSFTFWDAETAGDSERVDVLLFEAMNLMSGLEHLSLFRAEDIYRLEPGTFSSIGSKLPCLTFPRLLGFQITLQFRSDGISPEDLIAVFSTRHPTLTLLRIGFGSDVISPSARISLPRLQCFEGTARRLPATVAHGLRAVRLQWDSRTKIHSDLIILALKGLTNVNTISSHDWWTTHDCMSLFTSLSKHMPHTSSLQLRILDLGTANETERIITECLPLFNRLAYIALECVHIVFAVPTSDADRSRSTLNAWVNACPTLKACYLHDAAWAKVDGAWQNFSTEDFRIQAGLSVFYPAQ